MPTGTYLSFVIISLRVYTIKILNLGGCISTRPYPLIKHKIRDVYLGDSRSAIDTALAQVCVVYFSSRFEAYSFR